VKRPGGNAVRMAVLSAVVSGLAFLGGSRFTGPFHGASALVGGLWSMVSSLVVLQSSRRHTIHSSWRRVFGTLIGALLSGLYLSVLPFSIWGMVACVGVTVLIGEAAGAPDHARLAAITVVIVMGTAVANPAVSPVVDAALRFAEACIGTAVAVGAVFLWPQAKAAEADAAPSPQRKGSDE
jgi:uncharacterized membrane protein YccC